MSTIFSFQTTRFRRLLQSHRFFSIGSGVSGKQYGVFVCGQPPENYVTKYGDYGDMTIEFLTSNKSNDGSVSNINNWKKYMCFNGEMPTIDELSQLNGIILTGSAADAHSTDVDWVNDLRSLVNNIYQNKNGSLKHLQIVGLCFGHQIIANALTNGQTGRSKSGWQIGLQSIQLTQNFNRIFNTNYNIYNKDCDSDGDSDGISGGNMNGKIIKLHQDCVLQMPPNGTILGTSDNTAIEMYALTENNFNTLCMQGHPEFTSEYLKFIADYRRKSGAVSEQIVKDAIESVERDEADTQLWQQMIQNWLEK